MTENDLLAIQKERWGRGLNLEKFGTLWKRAQSIVLITHEHLPATEGEFWMKCRDKFFELGGELEEQNGKPMPKEYWR